METRLDKDGKGKLFFWVNWCYLTLYREHEPPMRCLMDMPQQTLMNICTPMDIVNKIVAEVGLKSYDDLPGPDAEVIRGEVVPGSYFEELYWEGEKDRKKVKRSISKSLRNLEDRILGI